MSHGPGYVFCLRKTFKEKKKSGSIFLLRQGCNETCVMLESCRKQLMYLLNYLTIEKTHKEDKKKGVREGKMKSEYMILKYLFGCKQPISNINP